MTAAVSTESLNGAAPPAAEGEPLPTLQQRMEVLHEQFREETKAAASEPAGESAPLASVPPADSPADSAADATKDGKDDKPAPPADPVAARKERIKLLQERERHAAAKKADQRAAEDRLSRELEAARKEAAEIKSRLEEAEARASSRLDRSVAKDPVAVLRLMEEEGVPANRVAEALREAIANPERYAEVRATEAAKKAVTPEIKALLDKVAALEKRDADREAALQVQQQQLTEQNAAREFFQYTESNSATAPYAAAFLKVRGHDEFYALAARVAQSLPQGGGWQPVLDVIEQHLADHAQIFAAPERPSTGKAGRNSPTAAAKATSRTLSNSLAQERASVAEPEDFASLPFDERVQRIKDGRR